MISVKKLTAAPSYVIRQARQICRALLASGGRRSATMDGYIITAKAKDGNAQAVVIDVPHRMAMCQPYLYETSYGFATSIWRTVDISAGRDAFEVPGYPPLTYGGEDPDVKESHIRRQWLYLAAEIGAPPSEYLLLARGAYTAVGDAVCTAAVVGDCLLIGRMNASQYMAADGNQEADPAATAERASAVVINQSALGATLMPEGSSYTVCPTAATDGISGGALCAHAFTEVVDADDLTTPWRAGVIMATYDLAYPSASITGSAVLDTVSLPFPLAGCNIGMMRMSGGLVVAACSHVITQGEIVERVRGLVSAPFMGGAWSVLESGSLFVSGDLEVYSSTPIVEVSGGVVCHRIRTIRDGGDALNQDAEDIGVSIATASGVAVISLGEYFPMVYTPRTSVMHEGRISTGIWDFPVGTGDWSVGLVQSACQCGADEIAVAVRPKSQFTMPATDIHVAIVRISTGQVLSVGSPILRGSLFAFVSMTCMQRGEWSESGEVAPAHLLLNLFKEAGAPPEPIPIVRGTYRSFDSGRTAELIVNLGATLCYSIGSPLRKTAIGG